MRDPDCDFDFLSSRAVVINCLKNLTEPVFILPLPCFVKATNTPFEAILLYDQNQLKRHNILCFRLP